MSRPEIIRYLILRSIGNFLFLFAIFGVLATFGPALYYEVHFRIQQIRGVHYVVAKQPHQTTSFSSGGFAQVLTGPKEQILAPISTEFDILIPKIGANAKVFPNIDPSKPVEFLPILQQGVAHAKGTVFPGMTGTIYLFAHSTDNFWDAGRYNAVFYLLKDLAVGDEVVVFYKNTRYNYKVVDSKIVDPSDVSYIAQAQSGEAASGEPREQLILQTCWPPGTAWKRLLVFAKPK